jgi:hypothetical protein
VERFIDQSLVGSAIHQCLVWFAVIALRRSLCLCQASALGAAIASGKTPVKTPARHRALVRRIGGARQHTAEGAGQAPVPAAGMADEHDSRSGWWSSDAVWELSYRTPRRWLGGARTA